MSHSVIRHSKKIFTIGKVTFDVSHRAQVDRIVKRWLGNLVAAAIPYDEEEEATQRAMDLEAVIGMRQVPLDLDKLEAFEDFDFNHDIAGIRDTLDRETGLLTHCFLPRAARG